MQSEQKDFIVGLDKSLLTVGMAIVAFFPTIYLLIFRPKIMVSMLSAEAGREGVRLGAGITFILALLLYLVVGYTFKEVGASAVTQPENGYKGLGSAVGAGNIWQSIVLAFPVFLAALFVGVVFNLIHKLFKNEVDLTSSVRIGFYILATLMTVIGLIGIPLESFGVETFAFILFPMLISIHTWQFYSFTRHSFGSSKGTAIVVGMLSVFMILIILVLIGIIAATISEYSKPA